jgi:hypothetical protein
VLLVKRIIFSRFSSFVLALVVGFMVGMYDRRRGFFSDCYGWVRGSITNSVGLSHMLRSYVCRILEIVLLLDNMYIVK